VSRARWTSLEEAAASVPDGASVAPGGFMLGRAHDRLEKRGVAGRPVLSPSH
jgi:glutaconate CoA-transferase subunit A